ncbi:transposable element Tc3 transposase [Trichonephila clavipes]|nr:transposable element Tc3 transposase [Trichonephila clavipes]
MGNVKTRFSTRNVFGFILIDFQSHLKGILFKGDEAHFWLNGYVNKQNCRIWSEANPQVYVETPLHPEKLTVWCALWAGGIIGPYFFKNDKGHNVTVNGDRRDAHLRDATRRRPLRRQPGNNLHMPRSL